MNPRDLPEVVAEIISEMHEVRTELCQVQTELRDIHQELHLMPDRIGNAVLKSLEPFLNRLLDHDDQLKNHDGRLGRLENPTA